MTEVQAQLAEAATEFHRRFTELADQLKKCGGEVPLPSVALCLAGDRLVAAIAAYRSQHPKELSSRPTADEFERQAIDYLNQQGIVSLAGNEQSVPLAVALRNLAYPETKGK